MYLIKEMPYKERPRERFLSSGSSSLSTHELIAIILRTGTKDCSVLELSKQVYFTFKTIKALNQASVNELTKIKGIGEAKAIQLLTAFELGKRLYEENFPEETNLSSPKKVFEYMKVELEMLTQEKFFALY
jgi:DNA repair protein RadC